MVERHTFGIRKHYPAERQTGSVNGRVASPWAYAPEVPYDAHARREPERAREAEVQARIAAARAKLSGEHHEAGVPDLARPGDRQLAVGMHDVLAPGTRGPVRAGRVAEDHHDEPASPPARPVLPPPVDSPEPGRCEACGYLTTAPGHLTECGDDRG
jgi:hypothetical protein